VSKQLVTRIKKVQIGDYYSPLEHKLKFVDSSDLPFLRYPNRVPCFEGNLYMKTQVNKGLSRRVKGGTLKTYAFNISWLVRNCFANKVKFSDLNDARFSLFIRGLQGERGTDGERLRTNDQVIRIGRQCINFLIFVRDLYEIKLFIGTDKSNAIKLTEKKSQISIEGRSKGKEITYYTHHSLPTSDPVKYRHPVSNDAAMAVKQVIQGECDNGIRRRDMCIFQSLEQTGGRRTEVAMMLVKDIKNALDSTIEPPVLRLVTLKRRDSREFRFLPVTHFFLAVIDDYIQTYRRVIIGSKLKKNQDHGYLFISHTTGQPLTPDTITSKMHEWREISGTEEQVFAQLFRHAFITKKLKSIILEHDFDNKDEFRKALLNTERFKMILKEWTGHTNLDSLDVYIDLAFEDIPGSKKALDAVMLKDSVKLMQDKIDDVEAELKKGEVTVTEVVRMFRATLDAFKADIERSMTP